LTLSQELFSSQDSKEQSDSLMDDLLVSANPTSNTNEQTVNPASLSPELGPVPDHPSEETGAQAAQSSQVASSDVTQHPAVSHLGGAPVKLEQPALSDFNLSFFPAIADDAALGLDAGGALPSALDADSYVLESGLLDSPNSSAFDDDYLVGDHDTKFSLSSIGLDDLFNHHGHDSDPSDVTAASFFAAAESGLDLTAYDPEIQGPTENSIQQPQSGASLEGCDDGGSAVVF
jgi:transcriptional activator HAC1